MNSYSVLNNSGRPNLCVCFNFSLSQSALWRLQQKVTSFTLIKHYFYIRWKKKEYKEKQRERKRDASWICYFFIIVWNWMFSILSTYKLKSKSIHTKSDSVPLNFFCSGKLHRRVIKTRQKANNSCLLSGLLSLNWMIKTIFK